MKFSIVAAFTGLVALVSASPQYQGYPGYTGGPPPGYYQGGQAYSSPAPAPTTTHATTVSATPSASPAPICLTGSTAKKLVTGFAGLLTKYSNASANALLSSNFTDTSSSINMLTGAPLDSVTFPSKAAFMAGQGSQPAIPFTIISIDTYTCTNVTFRWSTTVTPTGLLVKGVNSFVASNLNNTAAGWQIKTMYR